jgi:hypothetical protein
MPAALELHEQRCLIELLNHALAEATAPGLRRQTQTLQAGMSERLRVLAVALNDTPCPDPLCKQPMSLGAWCGLAPDGESASGQEVFDRLTQAYSYVLGQLAAAALSTEEHAAADTVVPAVAAASAEPPAAV